MHPSLRNPEGGLIQSLAEASALERKTRELAYLSVLASLNRVSGIPFHVISLKGKGASRDEIISAILVLIDLEVQVYILKEMD